MRRASRRPAVVRRRSAWLLLALALLVTAALFVSRQLERTIRARLAREAAQRGLLARVEAVQLGPWPPLTLKGLFVEKPGAWSLAIDRIDWSMRAGSALLGRTWIGLGPVRLAGPGGVVAEAVPTAWEVAPKWLFGLRAELAAPGRGVVLEWTPGGVGGRLELRAASAAAGRWLTLRRDGAEVLDLGILEGVLSLASSPGTASFELDLRGHGVRLSALSDADRVGSGATSLGPPTEMALSLAGTWQPGPGALEVPSFKLALDGGSLSGSLDLADLPRDPRLRLSLEIERLDFASFLTLSGLEQPVAAGSIGSGAPGERDLGSASLSARASGRLLAPASFTVSQHVDFRAPRRPLPALLSLRGDFVHEVVLAGGGTRQILVAESAADFVALGEVPPLFVRTLLLAEDAGFYSHRGIDLRELPSALLANWARGKPARGASTITQQLAKNLFLSRERSLGRKLKEACLALLLEAELPKERLLEIYLNVIEWGPDLYGLRPAARHYFGKEPRSLSPREMAFLVALIPGPVKYQRSFADGSLSPGFRPLVDELLAKLRSVDALSEDQYQAALAEELVIQGAGSDTGEPHPETSRAVGE